MLGFIALAILVRTFLWGGEAAPQKCPCPKLYGYSYIEQDLRTDHEKPSVWMIFGGAERPQKSSNCVSPVEFKVLNSADTPSVRHHSAQFVPVVQKTAQALTCHHSARCRARAFPPCRRGSGLPNWLKWGAGCGCDRSPPAWQSTAPE